ncbi:unnamed protein product, partial [Polarella glacialis]
RESVKCLVPGSTGRGRRGVQSGNQPASHPRSEAMATGGLDSGTAADLIFQTQSLRPFLKHPGVQQAGSTGFLKPAPLEHRVPCDLPTEAAEGGRCVLLRPFLSTTLREDRGQKAGPRRRRIARQEGGTSSLASAQVGVAKLGRPQCLAGADPCGSRRNCLCLPLGVLVGRDRRPGEMDCAGHFQDDEQTGWWGQTARRPSSCQSRKRRFALPVMMTILSVFGVLAALAELFTDSPSMHGSARF